MFGTFLDTPDKWKTLGSACVISVFVNGLTGAFAILFQASLTRYGSTRTLTSFPYIIPFTIRNGLSPLVAYLASKFGLRVSLVLGTFLATICLFSTFFAEDIIAVIIFIGIGFGAGFALTSPLLPSALAHQFKDHTDKSNGVLLAFGTVGSLIIAVLTELLIKTYGLSGAFLTLSALLLHAIPASLLLKKPKSNHLRKQNTQNDAFEARENYTDGKRSINSCYASDPNTEQKTADKAIYTISMDKTQSKVKEFVQESNHGKYDESKADTKKPPPSRMFRIFLDPIYLVLNLTQGLMLFVFTSLTVMVDASIDKGLTREQSVNVYLCFKFAEGGSRMFIGYFTDRGYISKINFISICYVMMSFFCFLFVWVNGSIVLCFIMAFEGVFVGGFITVGFGLMSVYMDEADARMAVTSRYFLYAPISITQPFIIGYFRDILKYYDGLFYLLAGLCLVSALMNCIVLLLVRYRDDRRVKTFNKDTKT